MKISPVPLSQENLGRYIAFLSRRLCFNSVKQYLNIVRLMHLESGFQNPLEKNGMLNPFVICTCPKNGSIIMVSTSQKLVLCFYCVSVGRESTQNVAEKHLAVSGRPLKLDGVTKFLMQKKF